ncbi:MAG: glycosyltransferase family 39 protein [Myxococcota bacterium]
MKQGPPGDGVPSIPDPKDRRSMGLLAAIVATGAGLRLATLGSRCLWSDELSTLNRALALAAGAPASSLAPSGNVPLYFWSLEAWQLGGNSEWWLRLPSVLFGVATICMAFVLARAVFDQKTALVAAALTAASPFLVMYSQVVRPYALVALLSTAALVVFLRAVELNGRRHWIGFALLTTAGLYTHLFAAAVPLATTLYLVLFHRSDRHLFNTGLLAHLTVGLVFLPWAVVLFALIGSSGGSTLADAVGSSLAPPWMRAAYVPFVLTLGESVSPFAWLVVIPAGVVYALSLALGVRRGLAETSRLWLLVLFVAVPIPLALALVPHTQPAHFLMATIPLLIVVARGVVSLPSPAIRNVIGGLLLLLSSVSLFNYYRQDPGQVHNTATIVPWRNVVATLEQRAQPADVILFYHPYYLGLFHHYYDGALDVVPITESDLGESLQARLEGLARVWLISRYHFNEPERRAIADWMHSGFASSHVDRYLANESVIAGLRGGEANAYHALEVTLYERRGPTHR